MLLHEIGGGGVTRREEEEEEGEVGGATLEFQIDWLVKLEEDDDGSWGLITNK